MNSNIKLFQSFYPNTLNIQSVDMADDVITVFLKSKTHEAVCPFCKTKSAHIHATHHRKIQDLPLFKTQTWLDIILYEYNCQNPECHVLTFTETYEGFFNSYCRMTDRLIQLIITLSLETSCEGAARIMKFMNIKISGDTVIRTLIKYYDQQPETKCFTTIGIDDFAFKKRSIYGTVIVNENDHRPVAILDGRDEIAVKEWLRSNTHIRVVTRDRASAYAKAIEEILPNCIQIADRFHLHKNLMDAVNKILIREIPATIEITTSESEPVCDTIETSCIEKGKKNQSYCG